MQRELLVVPYGLEREKERRSGRRLPRALSEDVMYIPTRDDMDPLAPQREAAMFYGLFLRGHSADALRKDIDVPKPILTKWLQPARYEENFRDSLRRIYTYRKKVLAIFDELVLKEKGRIRVH